MSRYEQQQNLVQRSLDLSAALQPSLTDVYLGGEGRERGISFTETGIRDQHVTELVIFSLARTRREKWSPINHYFGHFSRTSGFVDISAATIMNEPVPIQERGPTLAKRDLRGLAAIATRLGVEHEVTLLRGR